MSVFSKAAAAVTEAVICKIKSGGRLKPHRVCAIIVAAGSGTRMGQGSGTKQMLLLSGVPVVVRTIRAFEECSAISEIIVVAKADELDAYTGFTEKYAFKKIKKVVAGGETRSASVLCGFNAISEDTDYVAIHDGARCLVTPDMISRVVSAALCCGAAIAAAPQVDTVKVGDSRGFIKETLDRNTVYGAQTPQVFKENLYRAAAFTGLKNGTAVTDDSMLAESIGCKVRLVDCGRQNIKITTKEDIFIAEGILKMRLINQ